MIDDDDCLSLIAFGCADFIPGGHNTVRWILLGLDVFDFIVDIVFATRLMNTEDTRSYGILLTVVTCVAALVSAVKLCGRVQSALAWIIRFLVEDSTSIIIMFTVSGAYDPAFFIDILNLITSITFGILTFALLLILMCRSLFREPDLDTDCSSVVCAFISIGGVVAMGIVTIDSGGAIKASDWGTWLPWIFYAVVLFIGSVLSWTAIFNRTADNGCSLECCCVKQRAGQEWPREPMDIDRIIAEELERIRNPNPELLALEQNRSGRVNDELVEVVEELESEVDDHLVQKSEESRVSDEYLVTSEEESEVTVEC